MWERQNDRVNKKETKRSTYVCKYIAEGKNLTNLMLKQKIKNKKKTPNDTHSAGNSGTIDLII